MEKDYFTQKIKGRRERHVDSIDKAIYEQEKKREEKTKKNAELCALLSPFLLELGDGYSIETSSSRKPELWGGEGGYCICSIPYETKSLAEIMQLVRAAEECCED